ncbi:unnamed protein product, partial [Owenia fusiformis]
EIDDDILKEIIDEWMDVHEDRSVYPIKRRRYFKDFSAESKINKFIKRHPWRLTSYLLDVVQRDLLTFLVHKTKNVTYEEAYSLCCQTEINILKNGKGLDSCVNLTLELNQWQHD